MLLSLQEECTISYNAIFDVGLFVVALQIEDFLSPSDTTPLSSVPLQFLVDVFTTGGSCASQPMLVAGETPPDGSCIPVAFDTTFSAGIVATPGEPGLRLMGLHCDYN